MKAGENLTSHLPSMKVHLALACLALATSHAAIVVPGANGTDGALNITANTEIDLSLAPTAAWDSDNTANAGKGVYDASKWAVVFKYTSVNVAAGATVTFKNHPSRAPVVWLVNGNVTIAGTVSVNGQDGVTAPAPRLAEPGPGGFRGGATWSSSGVTRGSGFGIGGGKGGVPGVSYASSGSYGTQAASSNPGPTFGNTSLIPLIGGAGGGGDDAPGTTNEPGGGAGGGAILIASTTNIQVTGQLTANGGDGTWSGSRESGAGSGGGIRLVCDSLTGAGSMGAVGGYYGQGTGNGRIRLERVNNSNTISIQPAPSVVDLAGGTSAIIWPPVGAPEAKVVSLGGAAVPSDPRASFGTAGADVAIPAATTTPAVIETANVEQASQVKVRITPRDSGNYTEVNATYSSTVSTTPLVIRWTATLPTNLGYSAVQVRVIRP